MIDSLVLQIILGLVFRVGKQASLILDRSTGDGRGGGGPFDESIRLKNVDRRATKSETITRVFPDRNFLVL